MSEEITPAPGIDTHDVIAIWLLVATCMVFFLEVL